MNHDVSAATRSSCRGRAGHGVGQWLGLRAVAWIGAAWSLLVCGAALRAAPPELAGSAPVVLRPGVASVVSLSGRGLSSVREVVTSWTGVLERRDAEGWEAGEDRLKFPVFVPAGFSEGVEWLRVVGTNGVSNPVFVLIDGLPSRTEAAGQGSAQVPAAMDGVVRDPKGAAWRVWCEAGDRVSFEVVAQRLGGTLDPVLRVTDGKGREIARAGQTPGLGGDCGAVVSIPAAGEYRVEVRDAEYESGNGLWYRLRVGRFPVAVFPEMGTAALAGRMPATVRFRTGTGDDVGLAPWTLVSAGAAWRRLEIGAGGTLLLRWPDVRPEWDREREPNDGSTLAQVVSAGTSVAGAFDKTDEVDGYRLEISTPGRVRISVRSRSLGWPCDPLLRLVDAGGRSLATAPVNEGDPVLHHRFDKAGTYGLYLEEAAGRFGPGREYVVGVEAPAARFEMTSETQSLAVPAGGKQSMTVNLEARGYEGPIRIVAAGLPSGVELVNPETEARKKEWSLEFRCATNAVPGAWGRVILTAHAVAPGESGRAGLLLRPALRKLFPRMLSWSPGMTEELWIGVVPGP